jgi:hypothetical protein
MNGDSTSTGIDAGTDGKTGDGETWWTIPRESFAITVTPVKIRSAAPSKHPIATPAIWPLVAAPLTEMMPKHAEARRRMPLAVNRRMEVRTMPRVRSVLEES